MQSFFSPNHGSKNLEWINYNCFIKLWQQSVEWVVENLFVEILSCREIYLFDPYLAFVVIGELEAQILLYYASLEHQYPNPLSKREVSWQDYGIHISFQFFNEPMINLQSWQEIL